ncbi:MAG: YraN family protein [Ignavibacteriales bacterium]|nr:MAG: YraN family protein [Ignavibacteriales bacterium]
MTYQTKQVGDEGEQLAIDFLKESGYEIVETNYRYGKGEIDIIAKEPSKDLLIFVEVKSRKNLEFGEPEYAITKNKVKQIKRMAQLYFYNKEIKEADCRFDVVTILFNQNKKPELKHYINAFD